MSITQYAQKNSTQKKDAPVASSVLDSSSQSEGLQHKADMANNAAQRAEAPRPNNTGMPDNLKASIESLSGFSMDDVRVHYNSSKPATVQALAYTQGTEIHVAPGQEKHLPHEAWHVAQQKAGRVSPTTNINGMPVNDNAALEHEADVMGEKAIQRKIILKESLTPKNVEIKNKPGSLKREITLFGIKMPASFHHIYPKSELSTPMSYINSLYETVKNNPSSLDQGSEQEKNNVIELGETCLGEGHSARKFYWNCGNGFMGPPPEKRTDDPKNGKENKPLHMNDTQYNLAVTDRPNTLSKLQQEITNKEIELSTITSCTTNERNLAKYGPYFTQDDWMKDSNNKYSLKKVTAKAKA